MRPSSPPSADPFGGERCRLRAHRPRVVGTGDRRPHHQARHGALRRVYGRSPGPAAGGPPAVTASPGRRRRRAWCGIPQPALRDPYLAARRHPAGLLQEANRDGRSWLAGHPHTGTRQVPGCLAVMIHTASTYGRLILTIVLASLAAVLPAVGSGRRAAPNSTAAPHFSRA
jgi:hypothetical protein